MVSDKEIQIPQESELEGSLLRIHGPAFIPSETMLVFLDPSEKQYAAPIYRSLDIPANRSVQLLLHNGLAVPVDFKRAIEESDLAVGTVKS